MAGIGPSPRTSMSLEKIRSGPGSREFNIPQPILQDILARLSDSGLGKLKNWILAGPEGALAVFMPELYSRVHLDKDPNFVSWTLPTSSHYRFFQKCLKADNPQAIYAESLSCAFCCGNLEAALLMITSVRHISNLTTMVYIMLNHCSHIPWTAEEKDFKTRFRRVKEVQAMGETIKAHILSLNPRREDSYGRGQWYAVWDLDCYDLHDYIIEYRRKGGEPCIEIGQEFKGDRYSDYIMYYLSMEISKLA